MTTQADIVERAIAWALARTGSTAYALRCLAFVEDAYEQANGIEVFGGSSAAESADLYGAAERTGDPPRGAFVFFATSGPADGAMRDWGHVGLATGDGRMIHAWPEVRVDPIADAPRLPAGDWTPLAWVGWAPAARVLAGSRAARQRPG